MLGRRSRWVCWLPLCVSACSAPGEPTARGLAPLAGGSIDPDTSAVYALEVSAPNPLLCSATLVAPNLLLTARHCVSTSGEQTVICGETALGEPVALEHLVLDNVLSFLDAVHIDEGLAIDRIEVPAGDDVCGNDLAALLLEENLDGVAPLPMRLNSPPTAGEGYSAVGYGHATTNPSSRAGVRLHLPDLTVECVGEACGHAVSAREFRGSEGVCSGDSGGPAIDAAGRVLGIASRSESGCGASVYTSLPAFHSWLGPLLAAAAEQGGYPPPTPAEREPAERPAQPDPGATPAPASGSGSASAQLGEACDAERSCASELACLYEHTPADARCTARCEQSRDCSDGDFCDDRYRVCRRATSPAARDGCALRRSPRPARSNWMLELSLLGLGLSLLRQRRRGAPTSRAARSPTARLPTQSPT